MNRRISFHGVLLGLALGALAAAAVVAAAPRGGAASTVRSRGATVLVARTSLGSVLVDARGRTLYLFEKDRRGMSACDGACAKEWPPLVTRAVPRAGKGVHRSLLGLTRRRDGRKQVSYAGHPLYTFAGDRTTGQAKGQGLTDFGGEWYAVSAAGRTVESGPSKAAPGDVGGR